MDLGVLDLPDKLKIELSLSKELLLIGGGVLLLALLEGPKVLKRAKAAPSLSALQQDLFASKRKFEKFSPIDTATSDDPLIQCLERKGWNPNRIYKLQESISEKMTPDFFSGKLTKLTGGEIQLQENIDDCLKRISQGMKGKSQMDLFGCPTCSGKKKLTFQTCPTYRALN